MVNVERDEFEDEELMEGSRKSLISVEKEDSDDESGNVIVKTRGNIGGGMTDEHRELLDTIEMTSGCVVITSYEHASNPAIFSK